MELVCMRECRNVKSSQLAQITLLESVRDGAGVHESVANCQIKLISANSAPEVR
jgi:hypothetical protein